MGTKPKLKPAEKLALRNHQRFVDAITNHRMRYILDLGVSFDVLVQDIAKWQNETFGKDSESSPLGPLKHMQREIAEAIQTPYDASEYADLFILLLGAARRANIGHLKLLDAVRDKMKINKGRQWGERDADGVREHVKEAE